MKKQSPVEGNKWAKAFQDQIAQGKSRQQAYETANDLVSMKAEYGTGSPTQLKKNKMY